MTVPTGLLGGLDQVLDFLLGQVLPCLHVRILRLAG